MHLKAYDVSHRSHASQVPFKHHNPLNLIIISTTMSLYRRSTAEDFDFAADRVWDLPESLSSDNMLTLYGLYDHQGIENRLMFQV
jgi:hypothetical protein